MTAADSFVNFDPPEVYLSPGELSRERLVNLHFLRPGKGRIVAENVDKQAGGKGGFEQLALEPIQLKFIIKGNAFVHAFPEPGEWSRIAVI
jgi:hypothetical protein